MLCCLGLLHLNGMCTFYVLLSLLWNVERLLLWGWMIIGLSWRWQHLQIHYTLDVMHIEKNICENVVRTIFGQKNTIKVRWDMQAKGIWQHLWLRQHLNNQHKMLKSHASHVLTTDELEIFLSWLWSMKHPIDYGASLAKHVGDNKLGSMKSHDYHMLMQQVLPFCLQGLMVAEPQMAIMRLSHIFQWVCVKVWNYVDIVSL